MKVQLIQPTTGEYRSNSRSGAYPPVGLISIATYIKQECPSVSVEIIDGEIVSEEEIFRRLDGDIIGITSNTVTYPQSIKIAEAAKKLGAKVVLGGVYASAMSEIILNKRNNIIDTIVVGYGEKPMVEIINGKSSKIIRNHKPEFNCLPIPDRNFVDIERYIDTFQSSHPTWKYKATNIFSSVGCEWKEKSNGGCIFCSRSGLSPSYRNPKKLWDEIRILVKDYQIDYLVDFSDSAIQNLDWFHELVAAKPKDLNPYWHIFGRIDEINEDVLKLAKRLPCSHIFVGIESGDSQVYRNSRKGGGSPVEGLKAVKLLQKYKIDLTPSFVLGLPGENERSLQKTLEHAKRIWEITGFEEIFCCQLIPFPGSSAFNMLRKKVEIDSDVLDIEYLKRLWTKHFCSVDFQILEEYTNNILKLGKYKITITKNNQLGAQSNPSQNCKLEQINFHAIRKETTAFTSI